MVFLTRRATFSASHYYWNEAWTAEENERVFGRCANRNGHGHNYTLEVTVAGGARLSRVRVYETPEIFAEYRGGL